MWGFVRERTYNRRADIHERFGGQPQGGIVTPADFSLLILITGEAGRQHGYADRYRADGVFEYFGEGQIGDMQMVRGNRAIAAHAAEGKDLLLFQKERSGRLRFKGPMVCQGFHIEEGLDRGGTARQALVFELVPLDSVTEIAETDEPASPTSQRADLRTLAFASVTVKAPGRATTRTIYQRSRDVRDYVLNRAHGSCEGCGAVAPFLRPDGSPFLEPHHIRRLSDGGPDDPRFVVALCPNCHRRVHCGQDGPSYNKDLLARMPAIEPPPYPSRL